jgi:segregation and condensation protein A
MNLAQEAIAVLVDLAQRGEIDPWDVQVIEVIDRYLSKVGIAQLDVESQEANLSQSGQAFLWASMLVLLKANTLEAPQNEPEAAEDALEELSGENRRDRPLPVQLERHIRRRPTAPPPRRRRVTLNELIEQIQEMAAVMETPCPKPTPRSLSLSRKATARAIAELAHNENLTELAAQLEQFFSLHWPQIVPDRDDLDLDRLLDYWTQRQGDANAPETPPKRDRVGVFWALLLLSSQSKVELSQAEFYQDLKIRRLAIAQPPSSGASANSQNRRDRELTAEA